MEDSLDREPSPTFDSNSFEFVDGFDANVDPTGHIPSGFLRASPPGAAPEACASHIAAPAAVDPADFQRATEDGATSAGHAPFRLERSFSVTSDTTQEDVGMQTVAQQPLESALAAKASSAARRWMLRTFLSRRGPLHSNTLRSMKSVKCKCRFFQFAEDEIQRPIASKPAAMTTMDPSMRSKLLRKLRSRTPAITYNVRRIPAAIRHRWREEFVHPGNFVERFEQWLLHFIEKGKLHTIMDNWQGDKDLAFYYVMPALERSHPLLVALHRVQLDVFSFFLAAGCDIKQRGTVHPYSGDYLSSERDKLQKITPKELWNTLVEANAVEGSGSSMSRQLQAFRKYFDCSTEEARNRAVHHVHVLRRIYDSTAISDEDKKWLKDNCKSWLSYRNAGPLPVENAAGAPYWEEGGVLAMGSSNPASNIDFENPKWWKMDEDNSSSSKNFTTSNMVPARSAGTQQEQSVLLRLGVGAAANASHTNVDAQDFADSEASDIGTGAVTHFDPFYYPPDVSDYLQPVIGALCDSSRRGSAAGSDDISLIVWAWVKALDACSRWQSLDVPYDADEELLGSDPGIAAAVKAVAEHVAVMEGTQLMQSPRDALRCSRIYQAFIDRIRASSERTQDHPLLHAVHQVRPAAVKLLLDLCCSPSVRGTVHPYSGDDFSVADLQCISPIELARAYYPRMQMQSSVKAKRLKLILDDLLAAGASKHAHEIAPSPHAVVLRAESLLPLVQRSAKKNRKSVQPVQLTLARPAWLPPATETADGIVRYLASYAPVARTVKSAKKQQQSRDTHKRLLATTYDSSTASDRSSVSSVSSSGSIERPAVRFKRRGGAAHYSDAPSDRGNRHHKVHKRLRRLVNDDDPLEDQNPEYAINMLSSSSCSEEATTTEESDTGYEMVRNLGDFPATTIVRKHNRMPGGVKLRAVQEEGVKARYLYSEHMPGPKPQKRHSAPSRPGIPRGHVQGSQESKLESAARHAVARPPMPTPGRPGARPTTWRQMPLFGSEKRVAKGSNRVAYLRSFAEFADAMAPSIYDENGMRRMVNAHPAPGTKRQRLPAETQPRASLLSRNFLAHRYTEYMRLVSRIQQLQRWENLLVTKPHAPLDVKSRLQMLTRSVDSLFAQNVSSVSMMLAHAPRQSSSVGARIAEQLALPAHPADARAAPAKNLDSDGLNASASVAGMIDASCEAAACLDKTTQVHADLLCPTIPCVSSPTGAADDEADAFNDEHDLQNTLQMDVPASVLELHTRVHSFPQFGSGNVHVILDAPWKFHIGEASPVNLAVAVVDVAVDQEVDAIACEPLPMLVLDDTEDETLIRAMLTLEGTSNPVEGVQELISGLVAMSIADLEHLEVQGATEHFGIERFHPATHTAWEHHAIITLRLITRSVMHTLEFTAASSSLQLGLLHALLEGMKCVLTDNAATGLPARIVMPCLSTSPCTPSAPATAGVPTASYVLSAFCTIGWYLLDALSLLGTLSEIPEATRSVARECLRALLAVLLQLLHDFPSSFALDCLLQCPAELHSGAVHVHAPVLSLFCKLHAFWGSFESSLQIKSMVHEALHLVSERPSWTRAFVFSSNQVILWQQFHRWEMMWQLCGMIEIVARFSVDTTDEIFLQPDPLPAESVGTQIKDVQNLGVLRSWFAHRLSDEFAADLVKLDCSADVRVNAITACFASKHARTCEQRVARVLLRLNEGFQLQFCVLDAPSASSQEAYMQIMSSTLAMSQLWFRRMLLVLDSASPVIDLRPPFIDCVQTVGELQRKISFIIRSLPDRFSENVDASSRESTQIDLTDMVPCRPVRLSTIVSTWDWITSPIQAVGGSIQRPRSIAYLPEWIMRTVVCGDWNSFRVPIAVFRPLELSLALHKSVVFQLERLQEMSTSLLHDMVLFMLSASQDAFSSVEIRTAAKRTLNRSIDGSRKQQIVCAASSFAPSYCWLETLVSPPQKKIQSQVSSHFSSRPWLLFRLLGTLACTGLDAGESVVTSVQRSISTFVDMQMSDSISRGLIVQAAWAATMFIRKNHRGFGSVKDFFCDVTTAALEAALFDFESRSLFAARSDVLSTSDSRLRAMQLSAVRTKGFGPRLNFQGYQNDLSVIQLVADAIVCFVDHEICSGESFCLDWLYSPRKVDGLRVTQHSPYTVENVSRELCPVYCVRAIFQLCLKPAWMHFLQDRDLQAQLSNSADVCLISGIRLLERILSAGSSVLSAATASASAAISAFPVGEEDEARLCAVEAIFPAAKSYPKMVDLSNHCVSQVAGVKLAQRSAPEAAGVLSDLECLLCTHLKAWLHAAQSDKYVDTCNVLREACVELFLPSVWSAPSTPGYFIRNDRDAGMPSDSRVSMVVSLLRCVLRCTLLQLEVAALRGDAKMLEESFLLFFSKFSVPPSANSTFRRDSASLWQRFGVLDMTRTSYRLMALQLWPALCAAFLDALSSHPVFSSVLIDMTSDLPQLPTCIWETLRTCSIFESQRRTSITAIQRAVQENGGLIQSIVLSTWLSAVPTTAAQRCAPTLMVLQSLGRGVCWLRSTATSPLSSTLPSACHHLPHAWPAAVSMDMSWERARQLAEHVSHYVNSHDWDPSWRVAAVQDFTAVTT